MFRKLKAQPTTKPEPHVGKYYPGYGTYLGDGAYLGTWSDRGQLDFWEYREGERKCMMVCALGGEDGTYNKRVHIGDISMWVYPEPKEPLRLEPTTLQDRERIMLHILAVKPDFQFLPGSRWDSSPSKDWDR